MGMKTIYCCDRCDVQVEQKCKVACNHGRKMDAAGSYESDIETLHLCHWCSLCLIQWLLNEHSRNPDPTAVAKWIKNYKPKKED